MGLTKYDGGTAHPFALNCPGMSLRDYFAGQIISGIFANSKMINPCVTYWDARVRSAYEVASAMVREKMRLDELEMVEYGKENKNV